MRKLGAEPQKVGQKKKKNKTKKKKMKTLGGAALAGGSKSCSTPSSPDLTLVKRRPDRGDGGMMFCRQNSTLATRKTSEVSY